MIVTANGGKNTCEAEQGLDKFKNLWKYKVYKACSYSLYYLSADISLQIF